MSKTDPKEMTFLEHLEEFRWHIVRSLIVISIFGIVAFLFKKFVFDTVILGPSRANFITNRWLCHLGRTWAHTDKICLNQTPIKLQSIEMAGQFLAHIKISLIAGFIIAFPFVFWELWRFISPALYSQEKKIAKGAVWAISLLFFVGVAFGYFLIAPFSVNFLVNYHVSKQAVNNIKLMSYVSTVTSIGLAGGIAFELPVVVFFLTKIGILTPTFLKKYRKHALVVILTVGAIITPPDVFSQILVSVPLYLLYEISIFLSRRVMKRQQKKFDEEMT